MTGRFVKPSARILRAVGLLLSVLISPIWSTRVCCSASIPNPLRRHLAIPTMGLGGQLANSSHSSLKEKGFLQPDIDDELVADVKHEPSIEFSLAFVSFDALPPAVARLSSCGFVSSSRSRRDRLAADFISAADIVRAARQRSIGVMRDRSHWTPGWIHIPPRCHALCPSPAEAPVSASLAARQWIAPMLKAL